MPKVVVRTERAERAGRDARNGRGLAGPDALTVRPRSDVDGVLEHARDGAIVLGRREQHGVGATDAVAERDPCGGRRFAVEVLVIELQVADFDDGELQ